MFISNEQWETWYSFSLFLQDKGSQLEFHIIISFLKSVLGSVGLLFLLLHHISSTCRTPLLPCGVWNMQSARVHHKKNSHSRKVENEGPMWLNIMLDVFLLFMLITAMSPPGLMSIPILQMGAWGTFYKWTISPVHKASASLDWIEGLSLSNPLNDKGCCGCTSLLQAMRTTAL